MKIFSSLFGPIVRSIPNKENVLYLTFDDGPCNFTGEVLNLLAKNKVLATFFVVGRRAKEKKTLLDEIKSQGHSVGNHSLDHLTRRYFSRQSDLLDWIKESEDLLQGELQTQAVGFRPPAGVCTPPLHRALGELRIPLILWNKRFYDSVFAWTPSKANSSLENTIGGDIILLHDRQAPKNEKIFLKTLDLYIKEAKQRGFQFENLNRDLCQQALNSISS